MPRVNTNTQSALEIECAKLEVQFNIVSRIYDATRFKKEEKEPMPQPQPQFNPVAVPPPSIPSNEIDHPLKNNIDKRDIYAEAPAAPSEKLNKAPRSIRCFDDSYSLGADLFVEGKYEQALPCFQQAIEANPNEPYSYVYLVFCYSKQGKLVTFNAPKSDSKECKFIIRAIQSIASEQYHQTLHTIDDGLTELETLCSALLVLKAWIHLQLGNFSNTLALIRKIVDKIKRPIFANLLKEDVFERLFNKAMEDYNSFSSTAVSSAIAAAKVVTCNPKALILAFLACTRSSPENFNPLKAAIEPIVEELKDSSFKDLYMKIMASMKYYGEKQFVLAKSTMSSVTLMNTNNPWILYLHAWYISKSSSDVIAALDMVDTMLLLDPNFYMAYHLRSHLNRDKKEEALKANEQLLNIQPLFAPAWFNKGLNLHQRDPESALLAYDKVLEINSDFVLAIQQKLDLLIKRDKPTNEIVTLMKRLLDLNKHENLIEVCVEHLMAKGEDSDALSIINAALRTSSGTIASLHFTKARILIKQNQNNDAARSIEEAIRLAPNNLEYIKYNAVVQHKRNHNDIALSSINRVLLHNSKDRAALELKLSIGNELNDNNVKLECLNQLLEIEPKNINWQWQKGAIFYNIRNFIECYAAAKQLIQLNPSDGDFWALLAVSAYAIDKHDEARVAVQKAGLLGCQNEFKSQLNIVIQGLNAAAARRTPQPNSFPNDTRKAVALKLFIATDYDELTIVPTETLTVIRTTRTWALVRNSRGKEGNVPKSYIRIDGGNDDDNDENDDQTEFLAKLMFLSYFMHKN